MNHDNLNRFLVPLRSGLQTTSRRYEFLTEFAIYLRRDISQKGHNMSKVIMTCGKICSGKSTYAKEQRKQRKAVILSVDELTLALFGRDAGEKLDDYVAKTKEYLYKKSLEIIDSGIDVILDWGFWTKEERACARSFFDSNGIANEFHYIDIDDDEWHRRIEKRNQDILAHKSDDYYVDEGLSAKFQAIFEKPDPSEMDRWVV